MRGKDYGLSENDHIFSDLNNTDRSAITVDEMMFTDEIDCSDLFGGNSERERIMIFEIGQ